MAKRPGQPQAELNWEMIDGVLQFGATLIDCSELCQVAEDTIQRHIKKRFGVTFSEYRNKKMGKMRMKLLQKQYECAMNGNTALLIFLGKQYLGQSDKVETHDSSQSFELKYKLD